MYALSYSVSSPAAMSTIYDTVCFLAWKYGQVLRKEKIFQPWAPWRKRPRLARGTARPLVGFIKIKFQGVLIIYLNKRSVILGFVARLSVTLFEILHSKPGISSSLIISSTINMNFPFRRFQDPPFGTLVNCIIEQVQCDFELRSATFGGVNRVFFKEVQKSKKQVCDVHYGDTKKSTTTLFRDLPLWWDI